jgi:hypothetical protein
MRRRGAYAMLSWMFLRKDEVKDRPIHRWRKKPAPSGIYTMRLTEKQRAEFDRLAEMRGMSLALLLRRLVREDLERREPKP